MKEKYVRINNRMFIWIFAVVLAFAIIIVSLQQMDKKREFNQFTALHEYVVTSGYPTRFEKLLNDFDVSDTLLLKGLCENLELLEDDIENLDQARLFIQSGERKYSVNPFIDCMLSECMHELPQFPKDIQQMISYIDKHGNKADEVLFRLARGENYLAVMIRIDSGYLWVKQMRY